VSNPRVGSNTAADWLAYVQSLVTSGHLVAGDILIVNNASIHAAAEIRDPLMALLTTAGVRYLTLPTYSPELNPCELVFAQVKQYIRQFRRHREFWQDILDGFASVSMLNVAKYYGKCLRVGITDKDDDDSDGEM
jgi:transposase